MDLDQKLARDEAKIKARSDALLCFWGVMCGKWWICVFAS